MVPPLGLPFWPSIWPLSETSQVKMIGRWFDQLMGTPGRDDVATRTVRDGLAQILESRSIRNQTNIDMGVWLYHQTFWGERSSDVIWGWYSHLHLNSCESESGSSSPVAGKMDAISPFAYWGFQFPPLNNNLKMDSLLFEPMRIPRLPISLY